MGLFITLEGIDGSGKTTAGVNLVNSLKEKGIKVLFTQEPTDSLIGTFIKDQIVKSALKIKGFPKAGPILSNNANNKYKKSGLNQLDEVSYSIVSFLLFSADRVLHLDELSKNKMNYDIIICDRFIDSTFAYQFVNSEHRQSKGSMKTTLDIRAQTSPNNKFDISARKADGSEANLKMHNGRNRGYSYGYDYDYEDIIFNLNEFILKIKNVNINKTYLFDLDSNIAASRLSQRDEKDSFDLKSIEFFDRVRNNYLYLAQKFPQRIKVVNANNTPEAITSYLTKDIISLL
jgi:dTMP kinase